MTVENMLKSIPNDLRCTTGHWEIGRRAPADFKQVFHGPTLDRRGKHAHVIARILALLGHLSIAPRSACIALWLYNLTLYSIYGWRDILCAKSGTMVEADTPQKVSYRSSTVPTRKWALSCPRNVCRSRLSPRLRQVCSYGCTIIGCTREEGEWDSPSCCSDQITRGVASK